MNKPLSALKNLSSKTFAVIIGLSIITGTVLFFNSKLSAKKRLKVNPAFANYISAHTAGSISKESAIRIQFTGNFADSSRIGKTEDVFAFTPAIKGEAHWIDASTLEFQPSEPLPSGKEYEATLLLKSIINVQPDLEEFPFQFYVMKQSFEVSIPLLETIDKNKLIYQRAVGTLLTADVEEEKKVEQLLQAKLNDKPLSIKWEHSGDRRTHRYIVDSIIRQQEITKLNLEWNGDPIEVQTKGQHKLEISSLKDFKVMGAEIINDGSQYIRISFSDPIMANQDLSGLISIDRQSGKAGAEPKFTVEGHQIKCYPASTLTGMHRVQISTGIQNILGNKLRNAAIFDLNFEGLLPAVKFSGKGVIIPASNKLILPFEAVCLKAVDVSILKIYENNVAQFFQVNDFDGDNEMVRVGRPIIKKTIRLDEDKLTDLHKNNQFAIDLDKLIRTEPGAIYQVKISFKKAYSLYNCGGNSKSEKAGSNSLENVEPEENWDSQNPNEFSYWNYWDEANSEDYDWNERDNPCHKSYYNEQRFIKRNIMASDLGIIAKRGSTNEYLFAVTNLITTNTLSGVSIELLDYQQQILAKGNTDAEGLLKIKTDKKPFLAIAKYKDQRAYLKLDDGSSLQVSQFDVSGDIVQKGLKGFLYGERGVWRPGDSIYLTFILEDRNKTLPALHPVSLELFDPNGSLYKRQIQTQSLNGFYNFRTSTFESAPTGNWVAKVKVGGVSFNKNIRIETVMPNRLKIELNFDKTYLQKGVAITPTLRSKWLHGAIADGLNAKVDASFTPTKTIFKRFENFIFDDPTRRFESENKTYFDGKLDANGEAKLSIDMPLEGNPAGVLNANFVTRVFEPGGNSSIDRFSIPFHPYTAYVGIKLPKGDNARGMLLTDTTHTLQIVCVDQEGNLIQGIRKVNVQLFQINWRWWWDRSDENLSNYEQSEEYTTLVKGEVNLINGTGKFPFKVNYPEWGRYLIKVSDQEGHSSGQAFYMDWPGWAGRAQRDNAVEAAMLTFTANKPVYQVGETATITIPTPKAGRALLSIESGTEVLETHWIIAGEGQTSYSFKVTRNMLPNVYAHVTLMQPHAQVLNDLPIRMYGMMPIKVEDPLTRLTPLINMPSQIKPDENNSVTVSEANGKAMTYTVAIVDEGLLDLTRFKTPDPYTTFYAREALGVKTWDMFDYVMGAFGTQFNRLLSIGGDEGINRKGNSNKAKRFKSVVKFMGPFHLAAGQSAQHQFMIENYVGSVRVMVVAGENGAYGFAEKAVPVKKPLMVLASLPRVCSPGELVKLPVTVFAMENTIKQAQVQIISNELVQVNGRNTQTLKFDKPGDEQVDFELKMAKTIGIAKIKIIATTGKEKAVYEVELDVRNPNSFVNNIYQGNLNAEKEWTGNYELPGMPGTNTLTLEVSTIPALNLEKRLKYLIQYPYGCVEQTTSSVFPQLVLNNLIDLNESAKSQIEKNIRAGIQKIKGFQTSEGGISYWGAEQFADEWSTCYAGHFMLEAQNLGYSLPINYLQNWRNFQRTKALNWTPSKSSASQQIQAYRLFTLALAKAPEMGAMNRLKEENNLCTEARWRLAAAYVLAGNKDIGSSIIKSEKIQVSAQNSQWNFTYGSQLRDEAMLMETLVLLDEQSKANELLKTICQKLGNEDWYSTQSTAYALVAISKLCGYYKENASMVFDYTADGKTVHVDSKARMTQFYLDANTNTKGKITVINRGNQLLFARIVARGQEEVGEQTKASNNLLMEVNYKTLQDQPINIAEIEQGTDFKAEVTLYNPGLMGNYEQLALAQVFPSGWEIHNTRLDNPGPDKRYQTPRYQDIRDDRVYSYFNLAARKKVTFVVLLNASYLGKFYAPGFSCEAMYNGQVIAREQGRWLEVIPKK